ncbi:hypothetical protein D6833_00985, partial [Candidatus Parcubacteria bacterium]
MRTRSIYDNLNRLQSIATEDAKAQTLVSYGYQYNLANQCTRVRLADGGYWLYQYNALGQMTSGRKYWLDGTSVAGQQFEYRFDDIGNRKSAGSGGNEWGVGLRYQHYTANNLKNGEGDGRVEKVSVAFSWIDNLGRRKVRDRGTCYGESR